MKFKNSILAFQIFSIIFACILGTLLHFTYKWSNESTLVAAFSAVNESTWEHLKLAFFPMFITTIIGYFYFKNNILNFLCLKTIGIIISMSFIVIFFYTYTGIIGTDIPFLSIASFFIAIILGEFISYKLMNSNFLCDNTIALIILILLFTCFVVFTYLPPQIGLFKDPITNNFGITRTF